MTGRVRKRPAAPAAEPRGDRDLVHAARAGDTSAFDDLFYRYRDGIYRLSFAITKDGSAAEEIVVDTFARAYRALERLEPADSLRPWLYRVAINLSYNRQPRKGVSFSSLDDGAQDLATESESPGDAAERAERQRVVLSCIDSLGAKHKVVVVLHYLNGLTLAEIALIVDAPVGTVKSRLHYALQRLRVQLSAHPGLDIEPVPARTATPRRMIKTPGMITTPPQPLRGCAK
ncbi:MAG TPA: sigma-70 family RNA polymerase sigma factor [Candidatus Limnocylindria bacterium]|nr:sigma-70 family RNA polymerase sigma factor [Candidatus Limnocylindria bacterium]